MYNGLKKLFLQGQVFEGHRSHYTYVCGYSLFSFGSGETCDRQFIIPVTLDPMFVYGGGGIDKATLCGESVLGIPSFYGSAHIPPIWD